jgi:hypothetical protein
MPCFTEQTLDLGQAGLQGGDLGIHIAEDGGDGGLFARRWKADQKSVDCTSSKSFGQMRPNYNGEIPDALHPLAYPGLTLIDTTPDYANRFP